MDRCVPVHPNNRIFDLAQKKPNESFDSLVGIENRKSTEVVGKKPSKPTAVLANPSVINSSDHQPFEAEAKKEKAKAKEGYELETGMKLTGKETVLEKCNQDLAQESVQDYFKGREQSSKEEGKANTEKVNGNRWDQNDLNLRQERRTEKEQCQTSKPSCRSNRHCHHEDRPPATHHLDIAFCT